MIKSDSNNSLQRQADRLHKQRERIVFVKSKELKDLSKFYDKKENTVRLEGEKNIMKTRDKVKQELLKETDAQTATLENFKRTNTATKNNLDKQIENLKGHYETRIKDVDEAMTKKESEHLSRAREKSIETNLLVNDFLRDLKFKTDLGVESETSKAKNRLDFINYNNEKKIINADKKFADQARSSERQYSADLSNNEKLHQNTMKEMYIKNMYRQKSQEQTNHTQLKQSEEHYKDLLIQRKKGFEERYQKTVSDHKGLLDRLKTTFNNELSSIVGKHSQKKSNLLEKLDDPFYQLTKISPIIKDTGDSYIISLPLPKHEQENAILTANQRTMKLTLSRTFKQVEDEGNGSINRSRRSELFSKDLKVDDILNSTNVERSYNSKNGILSFKIAKL